MQSTVSYVEENINYGKKHVLMVIEELNWYLEDLKDKIKHYIHQSGLDNIIIIKTIEVSNDLSKWTKITHIYYYNINNIHNLKST